MVLFTKLAVMQKATFNIQQHDNLSNYKTRRKYGIQM